MAFFKCKMCGGDLNVNEGMSVCECEYCGTKQTLPKVDDEQKVNAMNRANHFRRQCEFDRAIEAYEKILHNSEADAELYWSLALCKYGIEYVDDPLTGKKIPTCHRMQYTSILDDVDYLGAIEHADEMQKSVYREQAEAIANIQKSILDISNKEEPFDVFICYKETGDEGSRTQDSVLAQDIYYGLTEKGYKVFFSKITLEGKLGTAYEPYIFAAINSSKVMIVVGTKPEYVNSVWVKNEWSRFLMLMQNDRSKLIIPAYRGMDPYDLPDALSVYQSLDMAKLGFMQDLIRGVSKVLEGSKEEKVVVPTSVVGEMSSSMVALIKRGRLALEDGEWDRAFEFFDQVLNNDAECAEAYWGQLLAQNHVTNEDAFVEKQLKMTEKVTPTKHMQRIEQVKEFSELLESEGIDIYRTKIEPDLFKEYEFYTNAESRKKQLDEMIAYFENDKFVKKAIRFAQSDMIGVIENIKKRIVSKMEERLQEAEKHDEQIVAEINAEMSAVCERAKVVVDEAIKNKVDKYNELVNKYLNNEYEDIGKARLQRMFEAYKDYRDASKYAMEIGMKINEEEMEKKNRLKRLQDEERELLNSFSQIKPFDVKRRNQLKVQLQQISEELERVKHEISNKKI